jgi:hypothetical protein
MRRPQEEELVAPGDSVTKSFRQYIAGVKAVLVEERLNPISAQRLLEYDRCRAVLVTVADEDVGIHLEKPPFF